MSEQTLRGSCLCKSVHYEVTTPFTRFGHCYCSRCRKATGGVRSTNIAVPIGQFRWTKGEELIKRFDLPEAKKLRAADLRQLQLSRAACVAGSPARDRSLRHARRCTGREAFGSWPLEQQGELGGNQRVGASVHGLSWMVELNLP